MNDSRPKETIFSKIIAREIPAKIVYETETVLAFEDVNPQAPTHVLLIPKRPIENVSAAQDTDAVQLGELLLAARDVARLLGVVESGYRLVVNNGSGAGQTVFHLHVHLLAGRQFQWPPG